jgi:hypothetical protein
VIDRICNWNKALDADYAHTGSAVTSDSDRLAYERTLIGSGTGVEKERPGTGIDEKPKTQTRSTPGPGPENFKKKN